MSFTSAFPSKFPVFSGKRVISQSFSEAVGLLDAGITKSATKVVSELLGVKDLGALKTLTRGFAEPIGLKDIGITKSLARSLMELLGLSEVFGRQFSRSFAEALGFYEYWGYVYPYYDPRQALDKLIRILQVAKALGIRIDLLLENPYIVYLIRVAARKMSGELYA
jgi:hypothetical protein